jgi:hypothetical protein
MRRPESASPATELLASFVDWEAVMVSILSLWLPIVLSAVLVFIVSSVIHMVLTYHRSDFAPLPDEDAVMDALRPFNLPQGEYVMPYANSSKQMNDPEFKARLEKGPVAFLTVFSTDFQMGKSLVLWFLYCGLIGVFAAYMTGRALGPGAHYLEVFRFAGAAAFGGYGLALLQNSIWYKRRWATTFKAMADSLAFALVTAGAFGWLWPAA